MNEKNVVILGTADIHGRYLPWDYTKDQEDLSGSLAQIATLVEEIREKEENVILLDAGDLIQGNSAKLFVNEDPLPGIRFLNAMDYDGWVPGNHEFDFGVDRLAGIAESFQGKTLGGNIFDPEGKDRYAPYLIKEFGDLAIGVVGMTTPMVSEFKAGTDTLGKVTVTDPVEETKKVMNALGKRVHGMVGLFHMGVENENHIPHTGIRDLIREVPGFDLVIAAHMHQIIEGQLIGRTLIGEPGKFGSHLLRMDLRFRRGKEDWFLVGKSSELLEVKGEETVAPHVRLLREMEEVHRRALQYGEERLGYRRGKAMVGEDRIPGIPKVQTEETALTDWILRVMKEAGNCDVSVCHMDDDKGDILPGPVRKKDIFRVYPYLGGEVSVYAITGEMLKRMMEHSAAYFNRSVPGDVTVSFRPERRGEKYSTNDFFGGVRYTMDLREPMGSRIKDLSWEDGTEISPDDSLTIGINAYRMNAFLHPGGALEGEEVVKLYSTTDEDRLGEKGRVRELLMEDIRKNRGLLQDVQGNRWKIIGPDENLPGRDEALFLLNRGILKVPEGNTSSVNLFHVSQRENRGGALFGDKEISRYPEDLLNGELYRQVAEDIGYKKN